MKLYKYCSQNVFNYMFDRPGFVGLKCDFPKNYNDPFELFLSLEGEGASAGDLAYYFEILGKIPQMPTSCFSKRPDVVPMWAHYGSDHSGYVIEIDESALAENISRGYLEDISYPNSTASVDMAIVHFAATTLKFRHTHRVQTIAFEAAYFTKNGCWAYEKERRLVVNPADIKHINGVMVLYLPIACVSAVISGPKTANKDRAAHSNLSKKIKCPHFQMKIGRLSSVPYFADKKSRPFIFNGRTISESDNACGTCGEPLNDLNNDLCHWCMVAEDERIDAAVRNPLRILYQLGLANEYGFGFASLKQIGNQSRAAKSARESAEEREETTLF